MFKLEAKVILSGFRIIILVYTARLLLVPGCLVCLRVRAQVTLLYRALTPK